MIALAQWMTPAPWGDTLRQTACDNAAPPHITFPYPDAYGPAVIVRDQYSHLSIALAKHMRGLCRRIDPATTVIRDYTALLDGLRDAFDVGLYSLNYDTIALTAWPDAFVGFDAKGALDAAAIHRRNEWDFLYHLHGSVHHSLLNPSSDHIEWRSDLAGDFIDGHPGSPTDDRSDGLFFPKTTLIAGGFKLDQLLVEPFHSLHATLVRHVYEADAILIGGYGFADAHVNRALRNRLVRGVATERPPIMVLDRRGSRTDQGNFRYDIPWQELCRTLLGADGSFFRPPHPALPVPAPELLFEVSPPHRVALWRGGFVEAAPRRDDMVAWLSGASDAVLAGDMPP